MLKERKGFTLIELMIVVAIIGILAAIAIPQYNAFRVRGYNANAVSNLKNFATSMEAYYTENDAYTNVTTVLIGYRANADVAVTATVYSAAGTNDAWTATSKHSKGDKTYTWDSTKGGLQ
jgi:prepilin-type N-terminal cleavage/methylation domain